MNIRKLEGLKLANGVIKSTKAKKALIYVVKRAKEFNKSYEPVRITDIGLSGSSLRTPNPRDIDIVVRIIHRKDMYIKWEVFQSRLVEAYPIIWNCIEGLRKKGKRVKIARVYNKLRNELLEMGFQQEWLDDWLVWLNVPDYEWGVKRSFIPPYIDFNLLVSKYLRHGWVRPRLEFEVVIMDYKDPAFARPDDVPEETIPYVILWNRRFGFVRPPHKSVQNFLMDETNELLKIMESILKFRDDKVPYIYKPAISFLKNKPVARWQGLNTTVEKLTNVLQEKTSEMRRLYAELDIYEGMTFNTMLTSKLKQIALVGLILKRILANESKIQLAIEKGENLRKAISESIKSYLIKSGYQKKDIIGIIDLLVQRELRDRLRCKL